MTINWKDQVCDYTRHCPRTEEEAEDLLVELYYGGMSLIEIGDLVCVAPYSVRNLLLKKEVKLRNKGGPNYPSGYVYERRKDL